MSCSLEGEDSCGTGTTLLGTIAGVLVVAYLYNKYIKDD